MIHARIWLTRPLHPRWCTPSTSSGCTRLFSEVGGKGALAIGIKALPTLEGSGNEKRDPGNIVSMLTTHKLCGRRRFQLSRRIRIAYAPMSSRQVQFILFRDIFRTLGLKNRVLYVWTGHPIRSWMAQMNNISSPENNGALPVNQEICNGLSQLTRSNTNSSCPHWHFSPIVSPPPIPFAPLVSGQARLSILMSEESLRKIIR